VKIHERIKEVRAILGLSQAKFAKRIAISPSYLAEIELGNKTPAERIIRLLAVECNVNDSWLCTGEGATFKEDMDGQTAKIVSMFALLSPQFKACALQQVEALVNLHSCAG